MGRYDFVSPGAAGLGALEQELMQRAMMARQRMLDEQQMSDRQTSNRQRDEELKIRRMAEERTAAEQRESRTNLEHEREFRRATNISENALPGDPVDDPTKDLLTRHGFGGSLKTSATPGIVAPAPFMQDNMVPGIMDVSPEAQQTVARGGSKYMAARTAAEERAEQARQAEAGRNERAEADRSLREEIARMSAGGRSETTALRNDLLQTQVDAAKQKATEKDEAKGRARNAARVRSQATINVLKELADFDPATGKATLKPGTANLFGMQNPLARLKPGSDTNNAAAALRRLTGTAVIDLINEMKNQSATGATGFGSLSGSEGKLLETSASELGSPMISDERAAAELERMFKMAQQLYGTDDGATGGGAVRRYNPATGRIE